MAEGVGFLHERKVDSPLDSEREEMGTTDALDCPTCVGTEKNAEHIFYECPHFRTARVTAEKELNTRLTPENMVEQMLLSEKAWRTICAYATVVMNEPRRTERTRRKTMPEK
ncbi:hypothetical protein PV327_010999 [Microctonus hyperodae]|uniref:Reverse transcriptase n=1 Tax=Microctonus hyperodae TaxID=165561 RepID=A0AA39C7V9_MICHY|nr:hypothetical protein PV327_010999 [Microctonus hyperodae]